MEVKEIETPVIQLDVQARSDDVKRCHEPLFKGLDINNILSTIKSVQNKKSTTVSENRHLRVAKKPQSNGEKTIFGGLDLKSLAPLFESFKDRKESNFFTAISHPSLDAPQSKICTMDVVNSLLKVKKNKRVKESTINTYKKRLMLFAQRFSFLPENHEAIMDYLSSFNGESGRHRLNHQDLLNMLYEHAVRHFGLLKNPVAELERPLITHKPVKTISLEQLQRLDQAPKTFLERTALDLLIYHGWRQIELRRVQAKDAVAIEQNLILCRGKEREELAPLLKETVERLKKLIENLGPDDFIFSSQRTRNGSRQPLGEKGMSKLVSRLFSRAGIKGFTGHDLRRTFTTLVMSASHDEFLAMRLIRDRVPGVGDRYIRYPMHQLVEALEKYSPIRQLEESLQKEEATGKNNRDLPGTPKLSVVSAPGNTPEIQATNTMKRFGGDGGESNSPSRRSCPGHTTSLVSSLISSGLPQLTELNRTSR
jgi:integrase